MSAKPLECASGLPLGHPTYQRTTDNRADRAERRMELVAIVESAGAILSGQDVFGAGARARRAPPLPNRELARTALGEPPVDFEVHTPHVQLLIHREADPGRPA